MVTLEKKLLALQEVYDIYDDYVGTLDVACEKYCADCCTCNVTLTALEAYQIITYQDGLPAALLRELAVVSSGKRYRPEITTNRLAELCIRGEEIPPEESDPQWGRCPFLREDACRIYPVRPFGCRCLISKEKCRTSGCAEVDPLVLTANTVFMQTLEHLDHGGVFGNLTDMLLWMSREDARDAYASGALSAPGQGLLANRPMPCLMVPEEHRQGILPLFEALRGIDLTGS